MSVSKPIIDNAKTSEIIIIIGGPKKLENKLDKNYGLPVRGRRRRTKRDPKREISKSNLSEEIISDVLQYFLGHSSLVYVFIALLLIYFDRNFSHIILGIFSALMALTLFLHSWAEFSSLFLPYVICLCIHTFLLLYVSAKTAYHYYEYYNLDVLYMSCELTLIVYNLLCSIFATKLYKQLKFRNSITANEPKTIRLGGHAYQIDRTGDIVVYRLKDYIENN